MITLFEIVRDSMTAAALPPKEGEAASNKNTNDKIIKSANDEQLAIGCLKTFHALLQIFFGKPVAPLSADAATAESLQSKEVIAMEESKQLLLAKLRGPLLAQISQSLLYFSTHKSKTIANHSLLCLYKMLTELNSEAHVSDWRNFFPGIFSGLYSLCSSGYKRYAILQLSCWKFTDSLHSQRIQCAASVTHLFDSSSIPCDHSFPS